MAESYDLVVKGGRVHTPSGPVSCDIGVRDERFVALGDLDPGQAAEVFDAKGLDVLPGVIDSQVHFREPGLEHKEDLESGSRAAAMGGVTGFFEMPNTSPSTLDQAAMEEKLARARGRAWTDHAFFMGAAAENARELGALEMLPGCCGVKIFMGSSTGSLLVDEEKTLKSVLLSGRRRVAVHSEDESRLRERLPLVQNSTGVGLHPFWRDVETAVISTKRLLRLARAARRRVHVLHITTADEMEILAGHKDIATVEVTPQHLTLEAPDCYERLGTFAQMNPPIRSAEHREGLWRAINSGVVDVIGSDHAPHTREEKEGGVYPATPSGMPGVQTLLPLMLNHVNQGRLTLARLIDLTSAGPQRIFNIAGKGRIALGYDADLTLVDMNAQREITSQWLQAKCGWSPFEGMTVTGWPMATIIRGNIVMREDTLLGEPLGEPVRFQETL